MRHRRFAFAMKMNWNVEFDLKPWKDARLAVRARTYGCAGLRIGA